MDQHEEATETTRILNQDVEDVDSDIYVYNRRWYVLAVFSFGSFIQTFVWNTWGPITESAEELFDWEDSTIGMLANYGSIGFALTVLPMCYFMDVKGLRISMLICSVLVMAGTGIRCITMEPVAVTWLATVGALLNGIGGTVPFAGSAAIPSVWFPPDQRATATATVTFCNSLGAALSFIIGPKMVSSPVYGTPRETNITTTTSSVHEVMFVHMTNSSNTTTKVLLNKSQMRSDVRDYLYLLAGLGALLFLAVLVYFPDRPPKPPSRSASVTRTDYTKGLKRLLRNGKIWLILCACAIPSGVLGVWQSVLDVNLKPLGISQIIGGIGMSGVFKSVVGYMGFWQTIAGCFTGLAIARFSDIFMKRMKTFLVVLYIGATLSSAWFLLLWKNVIPFSTVSLYAACILVGACINGCLPLFFEIACETSYPKGEGVTGGFLTLFSVFCGICFLFVMLIPNIGQAWMNEALLGSTVVTLPLLLLFPARYRRTDVDITVNVSNTNSDQKNTT